MEAHAATDGRSLDELDLDAQEQLWQRVKQDETGQ
jgi:hypothetical protein